MKALLRHILQTAALLALAAGGAAAQTGPARFHATLWTTSDGLPAHTVTGLAQTPDGRLWIASTGGLARFDGVRFDIDTGQGEGGAGLPSPRLNGLTGDGTAALWVITEQGQIARREGGHYRALGATPSSGPTALGLDRDARPHTHLDGRLSTPDRPSTETPVAGAFARDGRGDLWVRCADDRACRVRGGALQGVGAGGVGHVVQGPGQAAVLRAEAGRWRAETPDGRPLGGYPMAGVPRLLDRHGRLWADDGATLTVSADGAAAPLDRLPLPAGLVAMLEDREGVVWAGTDTAGLLSIHETPFAVVGAAQGLPPGPALTAVDVGDGVIVSANDDLYRIAGGRVQRVPLPPGPWYTAARDTDGTLWAAGSPGILGLRADGTRQWLGGVGDQIVPLEGRLWIRAPRESREVAVAPDGTARVLRRVPTPPSHSLTLAPNGDAWIGTNAGLVHVGPDRTRTWTTADGLPTDIVRTVLFTDDGAVWIGTYGGGLARLRDGRIEVLDEARGLAENIVSSLFEDASGMLWMGGNRSIHRVRRADAEAVLDGRAARVQGVAYGRDDGLMNPEGTGWPALQASDGRLWFPTFEGVAVVEPARALALETAVPIVRVEAVRAGGRTIASGPAGLGASERRFTVAFAAASLRAPGRVRYQYRLDGLDEAWQAATADREATFTNVPPGDYTFRVRARTDDGAWSEEATRAVSVAPFAWETSWFRTLLALMALAVVGIVIRARGAQLRERARRLDATVAERTAQLEAEKAVVAAQAAQLRTLDEAKNRLFANVSHEFRTPLQLILGPLGDVAEGRHGPIPEAAEAQVRLATRNGHRLLALVEQLLALARSDASALEVAPVRVDAAAFAARVAEAFAPLAARTGIAFETDLPPAEGTFDPAAVETALANLLANAFSFTPSGGTVRFTLDADDGALTFCVTDAGPGLAPEQAARVFDRFYQADDSPTRRGSGTGIGLSLVREIADLHGGAVSVESVLGEGCTFSLRLPVQSDAPSDAPAPLLRMAPLLAAADDGLSGDGPFPATPQPPQAPADAPRVLVVDDNAGLRALVRHHLDDRYQVAEAADGHAALAAVREHLPDVVVSDVMMPGLDGFGLVRALRADPETDFLPVLLLTARAAVSDTVEGLGLGADDYLAKPFAPAELRARVDAMLAGQRRLRARWAGPAAPLPAYTLPGATSEQQTLVGTLVAAIDARIDDGTLGLEALAEAAGMSRSTLYRRLDGAIDGTPADLLRTVRIDRAAALLREGAGTVTEVAYAVGFQNVSSFSARFRAHHGTTPSAFARGAKA